MAATLTTLHDFTGIEGAFPVGRLIETSDGKFYGSTNGGGLHGYGTLYRIDPSGQFEVLYSFGSVGDAQYGTTLIEASDGYLYGGTHAGGSFSLGAIFRMDKNGDDDRHSLLRKSTRRTEMRRAMRLMEGADGKLYGTTFRGGEFGGGTLFRVDPSATLPVSSISPDIGDGGRAERVS